MDILVKTGLKQMGVKQRKKINGFAGLKTMNNLRMTLTVLHIDLLAELLYANATWDK